MVTVRVTVAVWVVEPLVPVMVMVWLPRTAVRLTVMVMVELPAPVMEAGLKLTELRSPSPEAESAMDELKPPVTDEETVTLPELPLAMLIEVGLAAMEKAGGTAVTVSVTVAVLVVLPALPETVMV